MKANIVKQLHDIVVYRSPFTKQKLENMKLADILSVLDYVKEEIEKGADFRFQWNYEFVKPIVKKEKALGKKKK